MMQPPPTSTEPIVINLTPPEVQVAAGGEPVELIAHVRNASTTVDQYSIEIENLDPSWYTILVQSVSLFPGDSAPIPIRIHPPKGSGTRAGHHTFIVRGRSQADPSLVGVTKGVVIIASFANFQVELAPKRYTGYRGKYKLNITNGGNAETQLELTARDPESALSYRFSPNMPTVQPGKRLPVPISVGKRGFRIVGEPEKHQFIINARPVDGTEKEAKEVQGELVQKPLFKSWKWPLIALAVLALLFLMSVFRLSVNPCDVRYYVPGQSGSIPFYAGLLCSSRLPNTLKVFEPPVEAAKANCRSGAGFTEIRQDPDFKELVGECIEDEWGRTGTPDSPTGDPLDNVHQKTQNGELLFIKRNPPEKPQIYFFSKTGKIYTFVRCNPDDTFKNCKLLEILAPTPVPQR